MIVDVDRAWSKLHTRLKDGDLLVEANEKVINGSFSVKLRRVAAIAIFCICCGSFALYLNLRNEKESFVSIYNSEMSNILVSTLEDGSIVFLSAGGVLQCSEPFTSGKRQVSLRGEALFDVNSDKNRPFLIETEPVLVEVTGTEFNIKTDGKESFELSVLHGSVNVTVKTTGITLEVKSGEMVRLQSGQLQKSMSFDREQFESYTQKMQFKDERLDNIVRVIQKISGKSVILTDDRLKDMELTIAFDNNTVEEMIGLLCKVVNLNFTNDGNDIFIGQ